MKKNLWVMLILMMSVVAVGIGAYRSMGNSHCSIKVDPVIPNFYSVVHMRSDLPVGSHYVVYSVERKGYDHGRLWGLESELYGLTFGLGPHLVRGKIFGEDGEMKASCWTIAFVTPSRVPSQETCLVPSDLVEIGRNQGAGQRYSVYDPSALYSELNNLLVVTDWKHDPLGLEHHFVYRGNTLLLDGGVEIFYACDGGIYTNQPSTEDEIDKLTREHFARRVIFFENR